VIIWQPYHTVMSGKFEEDSNVGKQPSWQSGVLAYERGPGGLRNNWRTIIMKVGFPLKWQKQIPALFSNINPRKSWPRGVVALSVEYRTCDREVVGSSLGRARSIETLAKFLTPVCLCSPSSIRWYRPKGSDALRLGSKSRYGSCVGGR